MYEELVNLLREPCQYENCVLCKQGADAIESMCEMVATAYEENANIIESYEGSKPRWIPVTERLPSENGRYLTVSIELWFGTTVVDTMRWSGVWMYDGRQTEAKVTHWMPLPEPPKED